MNKTQKISSVAIIGGTHGNELTGINLVNNLEAGVHSLPETLDYSFLIANPDAVAANTRFIDVDLNRQFSLDNLKHTSNTLYELNLAQTINRKIGPKDSPRVDFVIDIHNTTSNMGPTLIVLEDNEFYRNLSGHLKANMPQANILVEDEVSYEEHPYLCTCGRNGIMLELGAQPQGVSRADIYAECLTMLQHILAFITDFNADKHQTAAPFDAYRLLELVYMPMSPEEELLGLVHPNLQDMDFCPLNPGDPIFAMFDGSVTAFQGEQTVYPHFINEAAYKKSAVAFATAEKFTWTAQ